MPDPNQVHYIDNYQSNLPQLNMRIGPMERFAPRIHELRELAVRHPSIAALTTRELVAFVQTTTTRPLTLLTDEEVTQLLAAARQIPAQTGGEIIDMTPLGEDAPPVFLELETPPLRDVLLYDEFAVLKARMDLTYCELIDGIERTAPQQPGGPALTYVVVGPEPEHFVLHAIGPRHLRVSCAHGRSRAHQLRGGW